MARKTTTDATQPLGEEARLREENAALKTQMDTMLDGMIELQEKMSALEKAQTGTAAKAVQQHDETEKYDAELEALAKEFADYPAIEVFKRRALEGVDANTDIRLKGEPPLSVDPTGEQRYWHLRWFNLAKEGRYQQAAAEGYIRVQWTDLQDGDTIVTDPQNRTKDEFVRKGDQGHEMLYKIPKKLYDYKVKREAAALKGLLTSESRLRNQMAEKTAARVGEMGGNADQAGSFIASAKTFMTIRETEPDSLTFGTPGQ